MRLSAGPPTDALIVGCYTTLISVSREVGRTAHFYSAGFLREENIH